MITYVVFFNKKKWGRFGSGDVLTCYQRTHTDTDDFQFHACQQEPFEKVVSA